MLSNERYIPASGLTADGTRGSRVSTPIAQPLAPSCESEALAFLEERPVHTFALSGYILTNGIVSPHNRGTFYGSRDGEGKLEGVALIGHANLFEVRTEPALREFARLTRRCPDAYLVLGEEDKVESFFRYYQEPGQSDAVICRELLLEQKWPVESREPVPGLRRATLEDLELVVRAHARIGLEARGVDPLEIEPLGFRQRCARRIELGHTWVWIENCKLIFKAELACAAPQVTYLESIAVDPQERGKGYGLRCMSQLARHFLKRTPSVCLLVNEGNQSVVDFYHKAGFRPVSYYMSVFLEQVH